MMHRARRSLSGGSCGRWLLGVWLALLAGVSAGAAEYPVCPRPDCAQWPADDEAVRRCQGPLHDARDAPRRRMGRQQWRMRSCQARARQRRLQGAVRTRFVRDCLHRGR